MAALKARPDMARSDKAEAGTVLVTGAAGCIGAWVVAERVKAGLPVHIFDLSDDRRRLHLLLDEEAAASVPWTAGDIADFDAVERVVGESGAAAIVHLAALQVPFCRADPVAGAKVNVVGQVNVLEAARRAGIRHVVYASSVAALPIAGEARPSTLYGVFKQADEGAAEIYWRDWGVASVGLRPHTVYGPGRDQGLTSAPTKAMVAAAAGLPFTIPFTGPLQFQHARDAARQFLACAEAAVEGAPVLDLGGPLVTVAEIVAAIRAEIPAAEIACEGDPLPFPAEADGGPLDALIGDIGRTSLAEGVCASIAGFRDLLARGLVSAG
jgi:UDP-glucuronate 4-epimerase